MPIFDYKCPKCEHVYKDVLVRNHDDEVRCGSCFPYPSPVMTKLPAVPNMHLFPKEGIHLSNVSPEGETFYSKNEMKKYARKHNLELGALL